MGREGGARCARPPSPPPNQPQSRRGPTTHTQTAQRRDRESSATERGAHTAHAHVQAPHTYYTHTQATRAHIANHEHMWSTHTRTWRHGDTCVPCNDRCCASLSSTIKLTAPSRPEAHASSGEGLTSTCVPPGDHGLRKSSLTPAHPNFSTRTPPPVTRTYVAAGSERLCSLRGLCVIQNSRASQHASPPSRTDPIATSRLHFGLWSARQGPRNSRL